MRNTQQIALTILPFADLSPESNLGLYCRSFRDDLVTELSRFRQLRIIRLPENYGLSKQEEFIGQLDENYIVEGYFQGTLQVLQINVQLFVRKEHRLVWGTRLEGSITEMNGLQENLLRHVVSALQQRIGQDLVSKLKQRPSVEYTALEHWLYGMEELKKASVEADLTARDHFEESLKIQSDYAPAFMGMSLSYFNEWTCQLWERWDVSKNGAYEWARKAVELDDQNHIIAMVLGRVFLYEGSYNTAEYYFHRSLALNSNDPDTLFPIALYLVYLGLGDEALELYETGFRVNPFFAGDNVRLGGFIYFELGDYEKAASFIKHDQIGKTRLADSDAYCAGIYYYLGQFDKMHEYWISFLNVYRDLVVKGKDFNEMDAIEWLLKLNPHRNTSKLVAFLQFISNGAFEEYRVKSPTTHLIENECNIFLKENATWKIVYENSTAIIPEVKGFYDLQKLIRQPREILHCAELMGIGLEVQGDEMIDEKARKQYKERILNIQDELEEAELVSDFARLETLQEEYDSILDMISKSIDHKGRIRRTGNTHEKARSAITWRIRSAIARIEQFHPSLGTHFSNAVKTGTLCTYKPDKEIIWTTS